MTLARAANIATIALAFLAASLLIERQFPQTAPPAPTPSSAHSLTRLAGKVFPLLHLPQEQFDRQIVLVLSTKCQFCQESMPFYRELRSVAMSRPERKIRLAALFHQSAADGRRYLQLNELEMFEPSSVDPRELAKIGIPGTPAVAVLDANGIVLKTWLGLLNSQDKRDVLRYVNDL